jgi:hypothetical protein
MAVVHASRRDDDRAADQGETLGGVMELDLEDLATCLDALINQLTPTRPPA